MEIKLTKIDGWLSGKLDNIEQPLPIFKPLKSLHIDVRDEFEKWLNSEKRPFEYEFVGNGYPMRKISNNCNDGTFKSIFESVVTPECLFMRDLYYQSQVSSGQTICVLFGPTLIYSCYKGEIGFCPCPGLIGNIKFEFNN